MTVIILERVPVGVRGELTRWMLEIHTGVFVGTLSARVRDLLWDQVCQHMRDGAGFLALSGKNTVLMRNMTSRLVFGGESH